MTGTIGVKAPEISQIQMRDANRIEKNRLNAEIDALDSTGVGIDNSTKEMRSRENQRNVRVRVNDFLLTTISTG